MANLMMHSSEPIVNIIARASLDQYINSAINDYIPNEQIGRTCYANAVAAVLHLAMRRIQGRVPNFQELLNDIVNDFDENGAIITDVLHRWCQNYRLHFRPVDERGAREALNRRRPLVATFQLTDPQWKKFSNFYKNNPKGVLESKDLETTEDTTNEPSGHAVVLIRCNPEFLTFMNSWGITFADGGFFRVKNQSVLNLEFYDVFWTLNDLMPIEISKYQEKKRLDGEKLLNGLPSSVKNLPYECPRCCRSSPASNFCGHLFEAICPQCHQTFIPTPFGL